MPSIGPLEIVIVLVIVLLIFGPKRLPELGRSVGHGMREFKDSVTGKNKGDDDPAEIEASAKDENVTAASDQREEAAAAKAKAADAS